ncbi:LysR substrate-binding domain-containing protein [Pyruvatibacter mobilis]|uniref:LysR substrate-binding domain-containing protein n=1 Tax=Pyruvatibacter mobilis TaxID=1712261 RepID=UPI003BAEE21F
MRFPSASALRVFDAAARLGSFKAAAEELGVSPTAVSHQIRTLEEQLSLALFVRRTRRVELTEAGTRLAAATSVAFQQISDALEDLSHSERMLTVSTVPAFAALWLAPRLGAFEALNPDISVRVETSTALVDLSRDRRVDLAIRYGGGDYAGLETVPLATETFGAFGAPDYVRSLTRLSDAALISTRWVSPALPAFTWADWAKAASEKQPETGLRQFDQEQEVIQAGLAGQGLILMSSLLVGDMVRRGWLAPYRPDIVLPGLAYTAVTTEAHAGVGKVRRFLSWIQEEASASE